MKLKLLPIVLLVLPLFSIGQNVSFSPSLVSAGGTYASSGNFNLSYSVGEPATQTVSNPGPTQIYLTQGFQQPSSRINALNFFVNFNAESCLNSNDGSAAVTISGGVQPYTVTWSADSLNHGMAIDSLVPGNYTVTIKDANGLTTSTPFIILPNNEACKVKFYNGITPNGDGHNDTWIIENIEIYPTNDVQIYNRWGTEVWSAEGYDNNHVVWKGQDYQNQPLPDGTYFYIVTISGATPYKGWVQITR